MHPKTDLSFRLVVSDFSWPTIHATLEVLNLESIFSYSERVYRLSLEEPPRNNEVNLSWLASCASHTMNRFTKAIKLKINFGKNTDHRQFSIFSFSLLLNCTTLHQASSLFGLMVIIFCSEYETAEFQNALVAIKTAISERPEENNEIDEIIKNCDKRSSVQEGEENPNEKPYIEKD